MTHDLEGKVLVFLRTSSIARIPLYEHLRDVCKAILVMVHPFKKPDFDGLFHLWIEEDTDDVDKLQTTLNEALSANGLTADAVCTYDEYGVFPATQLSQRMGKRPMPFEPSKVCMTNIKSDFRTECKRIGLSGPKSVAIRRCMYRDPAFDPITYLHAEGITLPVVAKPSPGAGSLLARLCSTDEELRDHLLVTWDIITTAPDIKHLTMLGTDVHVVVEEFIGGQEVDVDCVVENGKVIFAAVSDNFDVHPPYFVEVGGLCPSALDPNQQASILSLLDCYVSAYGNEVHGVLHFEAKYDFVRRAAFVIEVNCRMGSAETHTMLSTVYGANIGECVPRLALGIPCTNIYSLPSVSKTQSALPRLCCHPVPDDGIVAFPVLTPNGYCASVNLYPSKVGKLSRAEVPDHPHKVTHSIASPIGTRVAPPPTMFYMLCWIVARGNSSEEAVRHIREQAASFIHEVEDEAEIVQERPESKVEDGSRVAATA